MSNKTLNRLLNDFYPYAKEYLGFDKDATVNFASDKSNADKPLGKTAYYDPANHSVTVYTDNRHPKDIMRSVSHELVHHAQNCRGDLGMSENTGQGYAQNDEHLREMEREAYEKGNLCFRDWEDGIKSNLQPGTIYEHRAHRSKNSMNNFKSLKENFNKFLKEDWQGDPMGGMSGGDSEQYESLVRDTIEDILEMEGTSIQAIQSPMQLARLVGQVMQQPGVEESGLGEDDIMGLIDDMQQGMMQENEAGSYQAGDKVKDLRNDTVGTVVEPMAGGAVIELEDGTIVKTRDKFLEKVEGEMSDEERMAMYDDEHLSDLDIYQESGDKSEPKQGDDVVVMAGGLTGAAGEVMELTTSTQGEPAVVIYLRKDADKRVMGAAGDEVIALVSDVQVDRGIQGDDSVEPEDDYNWVGHKAHYQESIDKIVAVALKEYGDHETQAQGGMVSSTYSSDPEMDQVADIAATVVEQGGSLMQIATALKDQGFSASLRSGVLMIDDKYFIGKPAKFDIGPDEPVQEAGPYVVGMMDNQMEEGFRGSDEEKEMTSKMSNKEFSDYHTRDKHLAPDLKGDMGPLDGMEGPFQFRSGAVLYYDNKAGKYYDRGKDMYLDNEEAARLTMENKQMKLKNVDLREKVKSSVMQKLKEMYDDDEYGEDPYMASLEAEFPWLADKKGGKVTPEDVRAMQAAERDAAVDPEMLAKAQAALDDMASTSEDDDDPTITMREGNFAEYGKIDAEDGNPPSKIGQGDPAYMEAYNAVLVARGEEPLPVEQPDQAYLDALQSGSMKPADHSYNMKEDSGAGAASKIQTIENSPEHDGDTVHIIPSVTFTGDIGSDLRITDLDILYWLHGNMGTDDVVTDESGNVVYAGSDVGDHLNDAIDDIENPRYHEPDEMAFMETLGDKLRSRVTKRLQELSKGQEEMDLDDDGKIEPEDLAGLRAGKEDEDVGEETEKNESLRDKVYRIVQETLNESDDDEKEEDKDKDEIEEGGMKYKREDEEEEEKVEEGKYKREDDEDDEDGEEADDDKEKQEENIAANPEDFFRKLRNESRKVAKDSNWNDGHRTKRSSMLNEKLMSSWFNK